MTSPGPKSSLTWSITSPQRDAPGRFMHSAINWEDNLLVFGGRDGTACLNSVSLLDTESTTMAWQPVPCLGTAPEARHSASLTETSRADEFFVFGGIAVKRPMNDFFLLKMGPPRWHRPAATGVPASARGEHTATLLSEGLIFIIGGTDGRKKLGDVHAFSTVAHSWTHPRIAGQFTARSGHTAVAHAGTVIVFGGEAKGSGTSTYFLNDVSILQRVAPPSTSRASFALEWSSPKLSGLLPQVRSNHSAVLVDKGPGQGGKDSGEDSDNSGEQTGGTVLMVFGGRNRDRVLSDTCVLHLGADSGAGYGRWAHPKPRTEASRSTDVEGRSMHSATLLEGSSIFIFGGKTGYGAPPIDDTVIIHTAEQLSWKTNTNKLHDSLANTCSRLGSAETSLSTLQNVHSEALESVGQLQHTLVLHESEIDSLGHRLRRAEREAASEAEGRRQAESEMLSSQEMLAEMQAEYNKKSDAWQKQEIAAMRSQVEIDYSNKSLQQDLQTAAVEKLGRITDIQALKDSSASLEANLFDTQGRLSVEQVLNQQLDSENSALRSQLAASQEMGASAAQTGGQTQSQMDAFAAGIAALYSGPGARMRSLMPADSTVTVPSDSPKAMQVQFVGQLSKFIDQHEALAQTTGALRQETTTLQKVVAGRDEELARSGREVALWNSRLDTDTKKNNIVHVEKAALVEQIKALETQYGLLERTSSARVERAVMERDGMAKRVQAMENHLTVEKGARDSRIKDLSNEKEEEALRTDSARADHATATTKVGALEFDLKNKADALEFAKKSVAAEEGRRAVLDEEKARAETTTEHTLRTNEELAARVACMEVELEAATAKWSSAQAQANQLSAERATMSAQADALISQNNLLREQTNSTRQQLIDMHRAGGILDADLRIQALPPVRL